MPSLPVHFDGRADASRYMPQPLCGAVTLRPPWEHSMTRVPAEVSCDGCIACLRGDVRYARELPLWRASALIDWFGGA